MSPPHAPRLVGWLGLALALLVACAVYLPRLGADGLVDSEGHRAVTAWELRERVRAGDGGPLVTTLFETPYLRKPPGVPWLMALSAELFGESPWSARLVSALAMIAAAGVAAIAAWAWFGPAAAAWAGCAQALTPLFWQSGRAAEIEATNNLFTQLACLALVHANLVRVGRPGYTRALAIFLLGCVCLLLAKGPASLPVLLAVGVATLALQDREQRRARAAFGRRWGVLWGLAIGLGTIGAIAVVERVVPDAGAVTQSPAAFMFEPGRIGAILAMPLLALASALPASLLMPAVPPTPEDRRDRVALALVIGCLGGVLVLMLVGVSNPRYAMPAFVLLAPLAGYAATRSREHASGCPLSPFEARRAGIYMRVLVRPWPLWLVGLVVASQVYVWAIEPARDRRSGTPVGRELARHLPQDAVIYAHELVEARPEVLHATRRALGPGARVVWAYPFEGTPRLPKGGGYVAIRTDGPPGQREIDAFAQAGLAGDLQPVASGAVHEYAFTVYRVPTTAQGQ